MAKLSLRQAMTQYESDARRIYKLLKLTRRRAQSGEGDVALGKAYTALSKGLDAIQKMHKILSEQY